MGKRVRCPGCQEIFTATPPEENIQAAEEMEAVQERPARPMRPRDPEPEEEEEPVERPRRRRDADEDDEGGGRVGKPHRAGTVLTLGILTLALGWCCIIITWVLGAITLSMASADLQQMARGKMDSSGQGQTQVGKILAMVGLGLWTVIWILSLVLRFTLLNN